jgi:hypothetical protein
MRDCIARYSEDLRVAAATAPSFSTSAARLQGKHGHKTQQQQQQERDEHQE